MFADTIQTLLNANAPVTTILTGGIYTVNNLGYKGLSRHNPVCATAFNATGDLNPCAVIKGLGEKNSYDLNDQTTKFATVREMVQIFLYVHGAAGGFTTLKSASNAIYNAIHEIRATNIVNIVFLGDLENMFSQELNDAATIVSNYDIYGIKGS